MFWQDFRAQVGSIANDIVPSPQDGGANLGKIKLLGRERVIIAKGRNRYVTLNGKETPIAEARRLDKEYQAKKKEAAKKPAAKKSTKSKK